MSSDARAKGFVDLLVKNRFTEAVAGFDATMKQALPADELQQTWQSLQAQVAGLFFVPSQAAAADMASVWTAPPYSRKESFAETQITIGAGDWKLPGTVTMPVGAGPFPAIALVHGSGPHDTDVSRSSKRCSTTR
jgi:hypothetical protein